MEVLTNIVNIFGLTEINLFVEHEINTDFFLGNNGRGALMALQRNGTEQVEYGQ